MIIVSHLSGIRQHDRDDVVTPGLVVKLRAITKARIGEDNLQACP